MNLIICTTPLQVLIAEKIIELYPNEKFCGLMLAPINNSKYDYYAQKLKNICDIFYFFYLDPKEGKINYIFNLFKFRFYNFFKFSIKRVILASIDGVAIQLLITNLVKRNSFLEIETFDDGLANITNSFLYNKKKDILVFIGYLLGNNYSIDSIRVKSLTHYTIYKGMDNIIINTKYISLFNDFLKTENNTNTDDDLDCVSIFIGQPIYELKDYDEKIPEYLHLMHHIFCLYNIDFYFPHPRDYVIIPNIEYIYTDLIFEDYIASNLNTNKKYRVYTFFSTCIVSMINLKNVDITVIKPKSYIDIPLVASAYDVLGKICLDKMVEI